MSNLTILGDTSGSVVLQAPAVAGSSTITLPTTGGTVRTTTTPGSVLQVIYGSNSTQSSTTSTSAVDTGLSATITPSSASNKILVMVSQQVYITGDNGIGISIVRAASQIFDAGNYTLFAQTAGIIMGVAGINYLDSPATTSATTYKTQMRTRDSGETVGVNRDNSNTSTIVLMEIAG